MNNTKPFGIKDKLGYMFGDFGNDFTFLLSSSFLLKFYTDIMGVKGSVVGIIMMVARFVDAFTDVGMGRICDRSKTTKNGKFKPWILKMCGPVALMSFLMYQSSLANMSMTFKIAYLVITYILWYICNPNDINKHFSKQKIFEGTIKSMIELMNNGTIKL